MLHQNLPHPPTGELEVYCCTTTATGAVIERVSLAQTGPGEVALRTERLAAGTYTYTLVVDGQPVATRQMLLNN